MKDAVCLGQGSNVYRTERYIVRQRIFILYSDVESNVLISRDVYFRRTPERDAEYEKFYSMRDNINGKRLPVSAYVREYRF